ncbi:zinc ribbon domain-containing protein [Lactiplantibacillus pentosus]|uniref:zinc ribbon domain-containing protein n=1 Tax=Lactiplantibacillus pentosus TaxID=1589 RepID=UPI000D01C67A|nr:zinc-ribbon domain-containing protein [Lactiplantibacillus pentosus]PRO88954.1 zinc ribbon domain-containing protein [Lactiplantibacillus pentosus]
MRNLNKRLAPANDQPSGGANRFCQNCGYPVAPTDVICPQCGYHLVADKRTVTHQATGQRQQFELSHSRAAWSKRKKLTWLSSGLVIIILGGGLLWGSQYYSRTATLNRAIANTQRGRRLTDYYTSSSTDLRLNKQKLLPIYRYYHHHPKALTTLQRDLLIRGISHDNHFRYGVSGHRWLVFPNYQIIVKPIYPKITTNLAGNQIKLDDRSLGTAERDDDIKSLGALVPGEYQLTVNGTVRGHQLSNSGQYYITSNLTYNLPLTTISTTLQTVPASAIYLNGQKVGTADTSGHFELNDEPWSSDMAVYARYTSSEGMANSKTIHLKKSDDQSTVDINYPNQISHSEADSLVSRLIMCMDQISNGTDINDVTDSQNTALADYFTNGRDNAAYNQIVKMTQDYSDDDDIESVSYDSSRKQVVPGPNGSSLVTYSIEYRFNLEDYAHVQTYQYTATMTPTGNDTTFGYQFSKITNGQKTNDEHESFDE